MKPSLVLKSRSAASRTGAAALLFTLQQYLGPRSRPSCDCTQAGDQESVTAIRRWNYQDKHRPVSLPSPLLVCPTLASAPPPRRISALSHPGYVTHKRPCFNHGGLVAAPFPYIIVPRFCLDEAAGQRFSCLGTGTHFPLRVP